MFSGRWLNWKYPKILGNCGLDVKRLTKILTLIMTNIWVQNCKFNKLKISEPDGISTRSKKQFVQLGEVYTQTKLLMRGYRMRASMKLQNLCPDVLGTA